VLIKIIYFLILKQFNYLFDLQINIAYTKHNLLNY